MENDSAKKIKLNLRAKTYHEINDDCLRLNIVKKDGTPNKNAFICLIIRFFFPYLKDGKVSLKVDRVFDSDNVSDNTIYVEPDRYSQDDFIGFYSFSKADSYGTALRMLIEKFFTLESDERERIVFSELYGKLEYAIKKKEEVTITTYDRYKNKSFQYPFDPYCLSRTKDRVFNYLIGKMYRNNDGNIVSLRISKIVSLTFRNEKYSFSSDEIRSMKEMIKTGPQFSDYGTFKLRIRFTPEGLTKLGLAYKNRPLIIGKEDDIVTFRTNEYNAMLYFVQFGEMIEVITPDEIRQELCAFHKRAFDKFSS